jgi:uncharacterized membrane protein
MRKSGSSDKFRGILSQPWAILLIIVVVGLAIRLHLLGRLSLWGDEGFSERASTHSFYYLWNILPEFEFNPPAYYFLLKAWTYFLGNGEWELRLLSVLLNVATIPIIFLIGRMLGERSKESSYRGLLASAVFTLSSIQVQYAQEARCYSLLTFIVALAVLCAIRLMRHWMASSIRTKHHGAERADVKEWLVFGTLIGLLPWIHNTGSLAAFALFLPLVYWWVADTRYDRSVFHGLAAAATFGALLFLPHLHSLLGRTADVYKGYWIQKPGIDQIISAGLSISGAPFVGANEWISALFLLLSACGVRSLLRSNQRALAALLVSVGLLPPLLEILISYIVMPVFLERTFLYASVPLALLAGRGIESCGRKYGGLVVLIVVPVLALNLIGFFKEHSKEPWREVVSYLSSKMGQGDPVFYTSTSVGWVMPYYANRQRARFVSYSVPFSRTSQGGEEIDEVLLPDTVRRVGAKDLPKVRELMKMAPRVGVVLKGADWGDPNQLLLGEVKKEFRVVEEEGFPGITVFIFERDR